MISKGNCSSNWMIFTFTLSLLSSYFGMLTATNLKPTADTEQSLVASRYTDKNVAQLCPNMLHHVFNNAMPRAEANSGVIQEFSFPFVEDKGNGVEVDLRDCIAACCDKNQRNQTCNVVFVYKLKCYHVRCISNEACLPKSHHLNKDRLQMVLVNPVKRQIVKTVGDNNAEISWLDILKGENADAFIPNDVAAAEKVNPLSFWKQSHNFRYPPSGRQQSMLTYDEEDYPITEKRMKQLLMTPINGESGGENTDGAPEEFSFYGTNLPLEVSSSKYTSCNPNDLDSTKRSCPPKEECVKVRNNAIIGVCQCIRGYTRNNLRQCISQEQDYEMVENLTGNESSSLSFLSKETERLGNDTNVTTTSKTVKDDENKQILVSVASKEVRLPKKEATLAAVVVPDEENSKTKYTYLWSLVTQPKGPMNGTISDQGKSKVQLSNLSEGLYIFKVSVTGEDGTHGEAMANVTVLPDKRVNKVPQVIISPKVQTIRQPTTNAVLDGSTSTDDDNIVSWRWEVVSGPIGYQPKLPEVNTLQLTDLTSPGNYTFQLTVTDSNNVTNSTTANVTVLRGTDYPPVANAGEGVILYLPNNNVTLNGTASTDDHEIVAWEWTKDASDESKAVDMQNTRTPYVQLSNLEEGMYTFVLKVTDGSGQSSSAKVHVFVKPPTNSPPKAVAGVNTTVNLPTNWAILNGSQSADDISIKKYYWSQKSGPNKAIIANANTSIANATALTVGLYEFLLFVVDENNNTAGDSVWIKVVQEKNAPPVANAGGDQIINLPVSAIYLNGSKSWDDLAVVNYSWTRDGSSLAMGHIIGNTDKQPVLILSNVVSGRYVFKLTVTDEQGLSNTDTVNIIVNSDPVLMNLVQLTLSTGATQLTQSQLDSIVQKIGLLMSDMKVHVRDLKYDVKSEQAILVFYVETINANGKSEIINGLKVERELKEKFRRDASILGTVFADIRTTICQNNCSGHGVCNPITRACICESFWMTSALFYWGIEEANCDWSILYVSVFAIVVLFLLSAVFWGIACGCRQTKKRRLRPKVQKYSLIGAQDEEAPQFHRTTSLTDSDTDSDVLFETKSKPNGILRSNGVSKRTKGSHGQNSYAGNKMNRRIRT